MENENRYLIKFKRVLCTPEELINFECIPFTKEELEENSRRSAEYFKKSVFFYEENENE